VEKIAALLEEGLAPCRNLAGVIDVRVKGAIGVVQMEKIHDLNALKQKFVERGVWIRAYGNIIYLTPAFTISKNELMKLTEAICDLVHNGFA
jgi:adenosylmethionine-8-amino-7-oxononanoate aminotransferase